jgi:hypothetical protein
MKTPFDPFERKENEKVTCWWFWERKGEKQQRLNRKKIGEL